MNFSNDIANTHDKLFRLEENIRLAFWVEYYSSNLSRLHEAHTLY